MGFKMPNVQIGAQSVLAPDLPFVITLVTCAFEIKTASNGHIKYSWFWKWLPNDETALVSNMNT